MTADEDTHVVDAETLAVGTPVVVDIRAVGRIVVEDIVDGEAVAIEVVVEGMLNRRCKCNNP